jgi:hypothetical protein
MASLANCFETNLPFTYKFDAKKLGSIYLNSNGNFYIKINET